MGGQQAKCYTTPEECEEYVNKVVDSHPVVLFTKRFSPYCYKATSSFKSINVEYEEILLSGRSDCQMIQDVLLKMTGARTVPRVFIHQKCIGGGNETSQLCKEKKLKALVDEKPENAPSAAKEEEQTEAPKEQQEATEEQQEATKEQQETSEKQQEASKEKEEEATEEESSSKEQAENKPQE